MNRLNPPPSDSSELHSGLSVNKSDLGPAPRELTWSGVFLGLGIALIMGAANAYVGLKVGMTVNASIPSAVLALLFMRRRTTGNVILEANIAQTIGSSGQGLAAGMIFTIPALFILGLNPTILEMSIWGALGGLLGICFMVPLRRLLIVREHGILPYPEGVACAAVLQSGERGGIGARSVIWGGVVGGCFRLLSGLGVFPETAYTPVAHPVKVQGSLSAEPALLGLGYIIGPKIAATMLAGAVLAGFVITPLIAFFGGHIDQVIFPATNKPIATMLPGDIHNSYVKYIGAGAVTVGGLLALLKSLPTIFSSFVQVVTGLRRRNTARIERTDRDIPIPILILIVIVLGLAMWTLPQTRGSPLGTIAVLVFGFFFVTVASRIVGIIGASSNPASGMTIAALLGTCLAFRYFAGQSTDLVTSKVACLSVGAIVCSAICIAGDASQDLKTGYLVRATPWKQQVAEILGVIVPVAAISGVILLLAHSQGFSASAQHPNPLPAPQANIMRLIVDGVLEGNLPWTLTIVGGGIAVVVELLRIPVLPFAVGFYLPMSLTTPIMIGALVRTAAAGKKQLDAKDDDPGVLTASGLVAGNGFAGIALVAVSALIAWWWGDPRWTNPLDGREQPINTSQFIPWLWSQADASWLRWGLSEDQWTLISCVPLFALAVWLWHMARAKKLAMPLN